MNMIEMKLYRTTKPGTPAAEDQAEHMAWLINNRLDEGVNPESITVDGQPIKVG